MDPAAIEAWKVGSVVTGAPELDLLITQLQPQGIHPFWLEVGGGSFQFRIETDVPFNEERLNVELQAFDSSLLEPVKHSGDDGIWTWQMGGAGSTGSDADIAQIDFTLGWGDCFVQCDGYRTIRAVVPPSGAVTTFDLGGDPLPAEIQLSTRTKPFE